MNVCAGCGREIVQEGKVSRQSVCPHCGAYLHSCVNCTFHSPGSHNDCREPQADFVSDKRWANFCDYFRFRVSGGKKSPGAGRRSAADRKKEARDRFDKLFGG